MLFCVLVLKHNHFLYKFKGSRGFVFVLDMNLVHGCSRYFLWLLLRAANSRSPERNVFSKNYL
jgi:hypothetical protein